MTSSRVPTSAALFLGLLLAAPLAFADQKDDNYNKATAAVNAGDSITARDLFCALPADYKDAAAQCTTYKDAATRTLNRYKLNYAEGVTLMGDGKLDDAAAKFRSVKGGDFAEQAKSKLNEIARLRQQQTDQANAAQQSAALEGQMKQKLDAGTNAWNSGDLSTAKTDLNAVTGSHQVEAQAVLTKIRNYEAAILKGQTFEGVKDFQAAKNAYAEAVGINPVGPATSMMAKAAAAANAPAPNTTTPANTTATVKPPVPRPQIDVAAYLAAGNKAMAKKEYKKARPFFNDVLGQDKNNQEAKDALAQITALDTAKANPGDDDATLKDIIAAFYAGSRDAEDRFKTYVYANQGKKLGLARFYAGASMLTRYYLTGATDQDLKRQAQDMFKAAKAVDGFTAPEKFISPKIMKAFQEAS